MQMMDYRIIKPKTKQQVRNINITNIFYSFFVILAMIAVMAIIITIESCIIPWLIIELFVFVISVIIAWVVWCIRRKLIDKCNDCDDSEYEDL